LQLREKQVGQQLLASGLATWTQIATIKDPKRCRHMLGVFDEKSTLPDGMPFMGPETVAAF
jgi:hypothetical protein